MKTVVLATIGSYGDLHPYMAVALALKRRGLRPVIATLDAYREKIEAEGIDFHPVTPSFERISRDVGMPVAELVATLLRSPVTYLIETMTLPYLEEACTDLIPVIAQADLVVVSSFNVAATMAAESLGKPVINAPLSPIILLSDVDAPVLEDIPTLPQLGRLLGPGFVRLTVAIGRWRFRDMNRRINAARARFGLAPALGHGILDHHDHADEVVVLYSPLLGGLPSRTLRPTAAVGFAVFDRDGPVELRDEIEAFLGGGEPPLVFTLGSMAVLDARGFYEDAARTARRLGRRALLLVGREGEAALKARLTAPDILVAGYAPHSLIFPRAAAVIHHGGIGTTAQGLRAGVPQLICSIFGDQPDNAYRIRRLGVGASLAFKRFSPQRAAAKLRELLTDRKVLNRAREVALQVNREDGAESLADHIMVRLGMVE